jgi:mRNA-degrading endonuclease RelE of RelBE toxin-antitoxin system
VTKYDIAFSPSTKFDLQQRLPIKVVDTIITFVYGPLAENPRRVGKPLGGPFKNAYSARRGDYRIIYEIQEQKILVFITKIEHRAKAYHRNYR